MTEFPIVASKIPCGAFHAAGTRHRAYRSAIVYALRTPVILALCVIWTVAYATPVRRQGQQSAAWTIMVYQDADNSLETPQLANLEEMLQVGSSQSVQVVVLCDRSPKSEPKDQYSDAPIGGLANWSGAKLLHVEQGKLTQLANWGNTNMGDPSTLRRFLAAAVKAYPASHYALILADHGSGWRELCVDETSGDAALSLRDLRSALEPFRQEHGKLDVVGLDACLLGSFEAAQALEPVAHILVASEELAPLRGWCYDTLLKAVQAEPQMTPAWFARHIVESYSSAFRESQDKMVQLASLGVTLSLLDLDSFPPLNAAMNTLGERCTAALGAGRVAWMKVARARAISEEYGTLWAKGEGGEEMHDLIHMMDVLQTCGDPAIAEAAAQVSAAAKKVAKFRMRGSCRPHSGGISVYFPLAGIHPKEPGDAGYLERTFMQTGKWGEFLVRYGESARNYAAAPYLKELQATAKKIWPDHASLIFSKTTNDIEKAYFLMLRNFGLDTLVVGRLPTRPKPDGAIEQLFKGYWFILYDRKRAITCPITAFQELDDKGEDYLAHVPAQIRRANSAIWIDVDLIFFVTMGGDFPRGQFIYAFASTKQGQVQIALNKKDSIRPVYTSLKINGKITTWTSDEEISNPEIPEDLTLGWGEVNRGSYQLGFEVTNLAGASSVELDDFELQ